MSPVSIYKVAFQDVPLGSREKFILVSDGGTDTTGRADRGRTTTTGRTDRGGRRRRVGHDGTGGLFKQIHF